MITDYELIFRHRGASYHEAMSRFPTVRTKEFTNLFSNAPLSGNELIVDCPSLGGYLSQNVKQATNVINLDYCPLDDSVQGVSEYGWGIEGLADRVVCLAASHHVNSMIEFTQQASECMKVGGVFHLADVTVDNPIRHFLDDFVGSWTSTGHSGIWRDFYSLSSDIERMTRLRVASVDYLNCPWEFGSVSEMVEFCRLLFGLDLCPSDPQIVKALEDYVGVIYFDGRVIVDWKLHYADFVKI